MDTNPNDFDVKAALIASSDSGGELDGVYMIYKYLTEPDPEKYMHKILNIRFDNVDDANKFHSYLVDTYPLLNIISIEDYNREYKVGFNKEWRISVKIYSKTYNFHVHYLRIRITNDGDEFTSSDSRWTGQELRNDILKKRLIPVSDEGRYLNLPGWETVCQEEHITKEEDDDIRPKKVGKIRG